MVYLWYSPVGEGGNVNGSGAEAGVQYGSEAGQNYFWLSLPAYFGCALGGYEAIPRVWTGEKDGADGGAACPVSIAYGT